MPPRFGFSKGALVGLVVELPLLAIAIFLLAHGNSSFLRVLSFTAIFAGLPAVITAGGVGRLAARALVAPGGRGRAILAAAAPLAVAAAGLALMTAIPLGTLPTELWQWSWVLLAGAGTGVLAGVAIGVWLARGARRAGPRSPLIDPRSPEAVTLQDPG